MSKVEIKNVQYNDRLSEETACFSATVYIDGVKVGEVSNRGHGGCDEFRPWEIKAMLDVIAKATLKPETIQGMTLDPDGETLIGKLLDRFLVEKDAKRMMKDRILGVDASGTIVQSIKLTPAQKEHWLHEDRIGQFKAKLKVVEVFVDPVDLADAMQAQLKRELGY